MAILGQILAKMCHFWALPKIFEKSSDPHCIRHKKNWAIGYSNSWVPWSGKQKSGGFSGAKAETFQIRSILGAENDEDRRHFEKFWEVPKNGTFWPKFGQNLG